MMKNDTYRPRPEPKGTCRVCGHARAEHTYAWPIGCHAGSCNCPHVFVKDVEVCGSGWTNDRCAKPLGHGGLHSND
jgi:hypothetical protein